MIIIIFYIKTHWLGCLLEAIRYQKSSNKHQQLVGLGCDILCGVGLKEFLLILNRLVCIDCELDSIVYVNQLYLFVCNSSSCLYSPMYENADLLGCSVRSRARVLSTNFHHIPGSVKETTSAENRDMDQISVNGFAAWFLSLRFRPFPATCRHSPVSTDHSRHVRSSAQGRF